MLFIFSVVLKNEVGFYGTEDTASNIWAHACLFEAYFLVGKTTLILSGFKARLLDF